MRLWLVCLAVVAVAVLGFVGLSALVTLDMSINEARATFDGADPLDRAPSPLVVEVLGAQGLRARLSLKLAVVLLDGKSRGGVDWMVDRPLLAWHLERTFTRAQLTGLFVATLETGAPARGLNAGALYYYARPLNEVDAVAVRCLVLKATGRRPSFDRGPCGNEGVPPPPPEINVVRRPAGAAW